MSEPRTKQDDTTLRPPAGNLHHWIKLIVSPLLFLAAGIVLIATLGVAQKTGWLTTNNQATSSSVAVDHPTYTCPMHPQIRTPEPDRCPICGMELVPATSSGTDDLDELSIKIEPAQRRLSNIQVSEVRSEPVYATINTIGAIAMDESRVATISSYFNGRIERLFADYTGVRVQKGDHLAVIYSPELFAAQVEYLESRQSLATTTSLESVRRTQETFVKNARQKLAELGLQENQIEKLERTGKANSRQTIFSTIGGTVIEKMAVEGKYVMTGDPIYRIADLSMVWLKLELYPEDVSRIRFGQIVEAHTNSLPNQSLQGRVAFIDPIVNERTRTVGVRVEFLNQDGKLRPGDYADASIRLPISQQGEIYDAELAGKWISPMHPQIIRDTPGSCPICGMDLVSTARYGYANQPVEHPPSLYVPRSALLMAGTNSVVYVEVEPGRFEIRPVTLGPLLRDRAIILDGLKSGDQVATAGNFLIDSQMQLAGKPSLIDPTRAIAKPTIRNEPLQLPQLPIASIGGVPGDQLESLFASYFGIQRTLAADQHPQPEDVAKLQTLAAALADQENLSQAAKQQLTEIANLSEKLNDLDLEQARHDAFRPISHAVIRLASIARGGEKRTRFQQLFCPMVKGGSGDWLQIESEPANPYWGSQMLTCGEVVRTLPIPQDTTVPDSTQPSTEADSPQGDQP
ncbi:MAG: DUF3347 domain-containing protein [Planctomycetaceae bacterium]|nr:DUF3347 domain-containing protein [Planctomycetaceae bacterium]